jgi:hypothetical protein
MNAIEIAQFIRDVFTYHLFHHFLDYVVDAYVIEWGCLCLLVSWCFGCWWRRWWPFTRRK